MSFDWPYEFPGAYWIDEKELHAVQDVIQNGSMFRYYGLNEPKYVDLFEEKGRKYSGSTYALGINSCTGALIAAMSAMGVGPGSEVIIPSYLWCATVAAIIYQNAIPVICEVDETFCMDPQDLEKKITPRTKLIVPIHMCSSPCNMDAIMTIANRHQIGVLEDTAQCLGGSYKGKKLGTIGQMGVYSLQLNKNITCGEGGLIVTNDEKLFLRSFSAHDMGMIRKNGRLATPEPDALAWGAGRRMSELCGAVASVQMDKLDQIVGSMRASQQCIKDQLKNVNGITFRKTNDAAGETGSFMIMMLETEYDAISLHKQMKAAGIHNVVHVSNYGLHIYSNIPSLVNKVPLSPAGNPWSLHENQQSVYSYAKGACPKSDALFARSVLLPIPSRLTKEQEDTAATIIRTAMENMRKEIRQPHYQSKRVAADA